jgi:hypothetical protein
MTDQTMSDAPSSQFTVRPAEKGVEVSLDGVRIERLISGFSIDFAAGAPFADVVLQVHPRHTRSPEFDGVASVAVAVDDPGPAAAAFLSAIDPEELSKAALQRLDLTNDAHGLTAAMLRQLTEWANGIA